MISNDEICELLDNVITVIVILTMVAIISTVAALVFFALWFCSASH